MTKKELLLLSPTISVHLVRLIIASIFFWTVYYIAITFVNFVFGFLLDAFFSGSFLSSSMCTALYLESDQHVTAVFLTNNSSSSTHLSVPYEQSLSIPNCGSVPRKIRSFVWFHFSGWWALKNQDLICTSVSICVAVTCSQMTEHDAAHESRFNGWIPAGVLANTLRFNERLIVSEINRI